MTMPCSHAYHADCIRKWVMHGYETCPMCRKQLTRDEVYCVMNKKWMSSTPEKDNEILHAELTKQREVEYKAAKLARKLMEVDNEFRGRAGCDPLFIRPVPPEPPKPKPVSTNYDKSIRTLNYRNRMLESEIEQTNKAIATLHARISHFRDNIKSNARFVKEMRARAESEWFIPSLNDRKWNGEDLSWLW